MDREAAQTVEKRAADLLAQMTLEEKVAQLHGTMPLPLLGAEGMSPERMKELIGQGIGHISMLSMMGGDNIVDLAEKANQIQKFLIENTRLGIPAIIHSEALNGFVAPQAVSFPTAIGLSSTWLPEVVKQMTDLIRQQMRAAGNHQALSPVLDIARDPRWGRVHETYGEDPYLCSAMGVAFVEGLQGADLSEGVIATGKHFLGYGLTEGGLNCAATHLGDRELYQVFARPFEAAIREAGLASIMNSYSEINGIPVGASPEILTDLLRERMGFQGAVVSDYFTVRRLVRQFHVARDLQEAAVQSLEAGLDVELPNGEAYSTPLIEAVQQGQVDEALLDRSVQRVLEAKIRLGLFEAPYVDTSLLPPLYSDPQLHVLARRVAEQSVVLLKNDGDLLPLRKDLRTIAVVGPNADSLRALFGGYTYPAFAELIQKMILHPDREAGGADSFADAPEMDAQAMQGMLAGVQDLIEAENIETYIQDHYPAKSVCKAIQELVSPETRVIYALGCGLTEEIGDSLNAAVEAARQADVTVVVLGDKAGLADGLTGEGSDRGSLALPPVQQKLLAAVALAGKPVVLVLINGRPLAIEWAAQHVPAILEAWYPGQAGGEAIARLLFGDANPGARLPVTIPRSEGQIPIYHYHKMGSGYQRPEENTLTQYTDMPLTPLYPFGFGLSYTHFEYNNLRIHPEQVDSRGAVQISCDLTNVGPLRGDEVVQLYLHDREARVTRPVHELAGFKRVTIDPDMTCTLTFTVDMRQLGFIDRDRRFVVEPGHIDVMIGSSSDDVKLQGAFEITGDTVDVMGKRTFLSAVEATGQISVVEPLTLEEPSEIPVVPPIPESAAEEAMEANSVGTLLALAVARLNLDPPTVATTIKFNIPDEDIYRLVMAPDGCRLERGEGPADATLEMQAQDALKIMTGKMNPMIAMAKRKLKVEGDVRSLMLLQKLM